MNQAQSEYKHLLTFRVAMKPVSIANPLNSAQLESTAYHAVVRECCDAGEAQTHRHTDYRDKYTFRLGYASREM